MKQYVWIHLQYIALITGPDQASLWTGLASYLNLINR